MASISKVAEHSFAGGQRYLGDGARFKLDNKHGGEKSNSTEKMISQNLLIKILWYLAEFFLLSYFK